MIPTCNPVVSRVLNARKESPFSDDQNLKSLTAQDISTDIENAYSSSWELIDWTHETLTSNDIIVVSPPRTGQYPILRCLHTLIFEEDDEKAISERIGWLESKYHTAYEKQSRRIFKSHLNLDLLLSKCNEARVVVVLRDPVDVLNSWATHCLALYQNYTQLQSAASVDNFLQSPPCARFPGDSCSTLEENSNVKQIYESFVLSAISNSKLENVNIIFYEDICSKPLQVVLGLSSFIHHGNQDLILKASSIMELTTKEKSSTTRHLSSVSLKKLELKWKEIVTKILPKVTSYRAFYEMISPSTTKYPFTKEIVHRLYRIGSKERIIGEGYRERSISASLRSPTIRRRLGSKEYDETLERTQAEKRPVSKKLTRLFSSPMMLSGRKVATNSAFDNCEQRQFRLHEDEDEKGTLSSSFSSMTTMGTNRSKEIVSPTSSPPFSPTISFKDNTDDITGSQLNLFQFLQCNQPNDSEDDDDDEEILILSPKARFRHALKPTKSKERIIIHGTLNISDQPHHQKFQEREDHANIIHQKAQEEEDHSLHQKHASHRQLKQFITSFRHVTLEKEEITEEMSELLQLLMDRTFKNDLIGLLLPIHSDYTTKVRFISAVNELSGITDSDERKSKSKFLAGMFLEKSSLFNLPIPPRLQPFSATNQEEVLHEMKNAYLQELIAIPCTLEMLKHNRANQH